MGMRRGVPNQDGFSLIELLIVVLILAVLAALAIATFLNKKDDALDRQAWSDLRNSAVLMESYFVDEGTYIGGPGSGGFVETVGVTITIGEATVTSFCLNADHVDIDGQGTIDWHYSNTEGKSEPGACP